MNSKVVIFICICLSVAFNLFAGNCIDKETSTTVTIKGLYKAPESVHNGNTTILKGAMDGEYVEVNVQGVIKDFVLINLKWDDCSQELIETDIVHRIDTVRNETVVIKTFMPEGIPSEKIKWKNTSGKEHEFIIHEDGKSKNLWKFHLE
ncbi:hypothetical protein QA601_13950 [Chitinispirillales bacterium ANBcel5]|uniref:hypothetical protein n=1 Tax=Cellulosispirillum alkaliphilum TaxID=3039283 RepID=UPI002A4E95F0|nr:hypothetical protein [Chitinispirillales bacterium ANBcel5]